MTRRTRAVVLLALVLASAACGGDSGADTPSASLTAPPTSERTTTTRAPTPEEEVEAAYLRSWDVYAEAVRKLDPSGLEESYAGEQLEVTRAEIERRARDGDPGRVSVEHDYVIQLLEPDAAVVRDRYQNHSVLLDPKTGEPREPDPNETVLEVYTLRRIEGEWKVTRIVRER